jgi:hypothetical protein
MRFVFAGIAVLACSAPAFCQLTAIGPFTGQLQEDFEGQPQQQFNSCLPYRVFSNNGDLCTPQGAYAHTTPNWSFQCLIFPHTGNLLYGSIGGPTVITLDNATTRFGGYFGSHNGYAGGTMKFYDAGGAQIGATQAVTAPADCSWNWNGWSSTVGIKRVEFDSNYPFGGGFLLADSLETDVVPPPAAYCTAKVNSLGCTPAIGWSGVPSATGSGTFIVTGTNVRNNKSGLLFYGLNGSASTPFQGGTLCVASQIRRTPAVTSGGTPAPANDCTGVYSIDMNAFAIGALGGSPSPGLTVPGNVVNCQWWGRDPGFPAPNNTTLTNGLQYTIS